MNTFDQKFGLEFLRALPLAPGVYRFLDASGATVYVGKAKSLRRRLAQYRLATAKKKHRRMRKVLRLAAALEWEQTVTHLDACLREIKLIQQLQPPMNICSAYSFLYPYIGLQKKASTLSFAMTSAPSQLPDFEFFGAFRSRDLCGEAYFSLMRLFAIVGHREPKKSLKLQRGSYVFSFRQLNIDQWYEQWREFFAGRSALSLTELVLSVVENAGARARPESIQDDLDALQRFWKQEAKPLREAIELTGYSGVYPVPQTERDPLFLQVRLHGE